LEQVGFAKRQMQFKRREHRGIPAENHREMQLRSAPSALPTSSRTHDNSNKSRQDLHNNFSACQTVALRRLAIKSILG